MPHGYAAFTRKARVADVTGVLVFVVILFAIVIGLFVFLIRP